MADLNSQKVDTVVVHCSATKASADIGAHELDEMHKARGWSLIGYHAVIRRDGSIEGGRPLTMAGAHAVGHNLHTVAVCLVGGLDANGQPQDNFTSAQYVSLLTVIANYRATFPNIRDVCGHRDLSPDVDGDGIIEPWEWLKACPCFDVRVWYALKAAA